MICNLSPTEIEFIKDGISQNIRIDGRERFDYRPFTLETGIISQANGSARVVLGATNVFVGVKLELGEPSAENPSQGLLHFAVECCPSASPDLQGKGGEDLNIKLSALIQQILQSSGHFDLESLCLIPNRQCWVLYLDAMVLDCDGNLIDAISVATRAALANTMIPKVNVIKGGKSGEYELELSDNSEENWHIPIDNVPIYVSFNKIGSYVVADPSLQEELCLGCRITIGVNKSGNICAIDKGNGMFDMNTLSDISTAAKKIGLQILEVMDNLLAQEKMSNAPKLGFLV